MENIVRWRCKDTYKFWPCGFLHSVKQRGFGRHPAAALIKDIIK